MKHGFMDMMWKRKRSLHNGLETFAETEKGAAGQVEHESRVDVLFYSEGVVHDEFLRQGKQ
jgi:hypothetical protein